MTISTHSLSETTSSRLLFTQVGDTTLAFPTTWVSEIFQAERKRVLPLPFYSAQILGILHQNGQVISLIAGDRLLQGTPMALKETLLVVQLSQAAGAFANVGIVVEHLLGSNHSSEMDLKDLAQGNDNKADCKTILFNAELLPEMPWQPQRWMVTP
jgi:chemotaxis signal transduction protein